MVTVDPQTEEMKIAEIPTRVVGFDLPYCHKHRAFYEVLKTIRHEDEEERKLTITRKCYCPQCREEGEMGTLRVRRFRLFKKLPPGGEKVNKITIQFE